jgi:hypothetical protein
MNVLMEFVDNHFDAHLNDAIELPIRKLESKLRKIAEAPAIVQKKPVIEICHDCSNHSSRIRCTDCCETFCDSCFRISHMSGKRASHKKEVINQNACDECDMELAVHVISLESEEVRVCKGCFAKNPSADDAMERKLQIFSSKLKCFECGENDGAILCLDCEDLFCNYCFQLLHHRGRMARHGRLELEISDPGKSSCKLLDNISTISRLEELHERSLLDAEIPFLDDSMSRCWFNSKTRCVRKSHENDAVQT